MVTTNNTEAQAFQLSQNTREMECIVILKLSISFNNYTYIYLCTQ